MTVDQRRSFARSLLYGNPTVAATIGSHWPHLGAKGCYIYGESSRVLATALALLDYHQLYGQFGIPFEVLLPLTPSPTITNWQSFLATLAVEELGSFFTSSDLLVLVDVNKQDRHLTSVASSLIAQAKTSGAQTLMLNKENEHADPTLLRSTVTGSHNNLYNPLNYQPIEQFLASHGFTRFYVYGQGLRVIPSLIGLIDFLARFDEGNSNLRKLASKVVLINKNDVISSLPRVDSFSNILATYGIPVAVKMTQVISPAGSHEVRITPY